MSDGMPIKSWSEEDRPREKLILKGKEALSEAELIAILIGSGSRKKTAVELSKEILSAASNNLHELSKWDLDQLMQYNGIGEAKAISIVAAMELGRRKLATQPIDRPQVTSSFEAYNIFHPLIADLNHEEFWAIFVNRNNRIIETTRLSKGGISATVVDKRLLFKKAVLINATGMFLAHNHPSGNLIPGQADRKLTMEINEAGKLFDIKLFDHLIVTQRGYYSFADENEI